MSVASSFALAVAERVERRGGPRAGLFAWKALAASATDPEVRGTALLAVMRCAVALGDESALDESTAQWSKVDRGVWDSRVASLCKEMTQAGLVSRATALAYAEARRSRTARSLYCYARCLDIARDDSAVLAFGDAASRAEREGAVEIELASRVRRVAILGRSWVTFDAALAEARQVDPARIDPASRLVLTGVLLRSPSRFTRAAALGVLDELVVGGDPALAERALASAARWADEAGDAITALEADRLVALFGRERAKQLAPRAEDAVRALLNIASARDEGALHAALDRARHIAPELSPLHARARDILTGRYETLQELPGTPPPQDPNARRVFRWAQVLDVVVAMRDRAPARAAQTLRVLLEAQRAGEDLPAQILTIAHAALSFEDDELREVAARVVAECLRRPTLRRPKLGYTALAETLAGLGMNELSITARRAAVIGKEPGAAESLGTVLAREGWELARSGQRTEAIQKLREAKALMVGPR